MSGFTHQIQSNQQSSNTSNSSIDPIIDPTIDTTLDNRNLSQSLQHINSTLCKCFMDDIRHDYPQLKLDDQCPICHHQLHEHRMKCDYINASTTQLHDPSTTMYAKKFRALKKSHQLPTWNKHNAICKLFLDDIRRVLRVSEIPKQHWYMVFAYITHERDFTSANWIYNNIIEPCVNDFDEACDIFTEHFQLRTYELELQSKWNKIQQRRDESA